MFYYYYFHQSCHSLSSWFFTSLSYHVRVCVDVELLLLNLHYLLLSNLDIVITYLYTQVDLVEGYADIKARIQRLVSVEIPELELCDVMTLEVKGSHY